MTNLSEGELLDLLPAGLKNDTDMICLSYAIKTVVQDILSKQKTAMTCNYIDSLPEKVLDILAVELRCAYYLETMDIEVKRELIKNALIWHSKAGTASAVAEMVETIFGVGEVTEWYESDDMEAGYFDILTGSQLTEDAYDQLNKIIDRVKNVRSHLRSVQTVKEITATAYIGAAAISTPHITIE